MASLAELLEVRTPRQIITDSELLHAYEYGDILITESLYSAIKRGAEELEASGQIDKDTQDEIVILSTIQAYCNRRRYRCPWWYTITVLPAVYNWIARIMSSFARREST